LLREAVKNKTALGLKAKTFMDAGDLVPDEVVIGLIEESLKSDAASENFILDGFPRTLPQATALDGLFEKLHIKLDGVVSMDVDNNEIIRRLSERLLCRGCGRIYILSQLPAGERTCKQWAEKFISVMMINRNRCAVVSTCINNKPNRSLSIIKRPDGLLV